MTRLSERDDFGELIQAAAEAFSINPAIVEKDYFVTEALRIVAAAGDWVLFKGGTSLSKGWRLISRFSEDIDLFVRPAENPRRTDRRLKALALAVGEHPALTRVEDARRVVGGRGRSERYSYPATVSPLTGLDPTVLLEAGIQSGDYPAEERSIQSLLGAFLDEAAVTGADDQKAFTMRLLHFRRTFVEKLFTVHDCIERRLKMEGGPLGPYARHYYDLALLLRTTEVRDMLQCSEYADIAADYGRLTARFFPGQLLPSRLCLAESPALFPDEELRGVLSRDYEDQCRRLCYGNDYPPFGEVLRVLEEVRPFLVAAVD
jgi:hypothetical protein